MTDREVGGGRAASARRACFLVLIVLGIGFSKTTPLSGVDAAEFLYNGVDGAVSMSNTGMTAGRVFAGLCFVLFARWFERNQGWLFVLGAVLQSASSLMTSLVYRQDILDQPTLAFLVFALGGAARMMIEFPLYLLLCRNARPQQVALCIAAGVALYTLVTHVCNVSCSYATQLVILSLTPLGVPLCYLAASRLVDADCRGVCSVLASAADDGGRNEAKIVVASLVVACMARAFLRVLAGSKEWGSASSYPLAVGMTSLYETVLACVGLLVLTFVIFVLVERGSQRKAAGGSYVIGLIIVVAGMQVAAMAEGLQWVAPSFVAVFVSACELFSSVLMWMTFMECTRRTLVPSFGLYGIMVLTNSLCNILIMVIFNGLGFAPLLTMMAFLYLIIAAFLGLAWFWRGGGRRTGLADEGEWEVFGGGDDTSGFDLDARAFGERYGLSSREQDVLLLLLKDKTRAEVGEATGLADGTIRTHVTNIHKKLGVHSRAELCGLFERERAGAGHDESPHPFVGLRVRWRSRTR